MGTRLALYDGSVHLGVGNNFWEDRLFEAKELEHRLGPLQCSQVHKQRAGCIGYVDNMKT